MKITNVTILQPTPVSPISGFICQLLSEGDTTFNLNLTKGPFDIKVDKNPDSIDLYITGLDDENTPDITGVIGTNEANDLLLACTLSTALTAETGHPNEIAIITVVGTFIFNE